MQINEYLINLNKRGIFLGPFEQRDHFFKRAVAIKHLTAQKSLKLTEEIFDASPDWVDICFRKKGLLLWEGAATWIEESLEGARSAIIQIKPSSTITCLYSQTEVIAHEMVHAMRLMFEDSRFEEILAFRTSKSRFRRYFGPLFARPSESKGFMIMVFCSWLFYWIELIFDFSWGTKYLFLCPIIILGWGIWRLIHSQKIFSLALTHLEKVIKNPKKSLAVALRLTDCEIEQFASYSPEQILIFAEREKRLTCVGRRFFQHIFQKTLPNNLNFGFNSLRINDLFAIFPLFFLTNSALTICSKKIRAISSKISADSEERNPKFRLITQVAS